MSFNDFVATFGSKQGFKKQVIQRHNMSCPWLDNQKKYTKLSIIRAECYTNHKGHIRICTTFCNLLLEQFKASLNNLSLVINIVIYIVDPISQRKCILLAGCVQVIGSLLKKFINRRFSAILLYFQLGQKFCPPEKRTR